MLKLLKRLTICLLLSALCWTAAIAKDRHMLNSEMIRFHVVANSDNSEDQMVKREVRDAVLESLSEDLLKISDVREAKKYLQENLPKIQSIANETLKSMGFEDTATVSLCKERFDIRYYDTFTLPSGVYESLRIVIGQGAGHNWWCVTFPGLCMPATSSGFADAAVGSGFTRSLARTLTEPQEYKVRFLALDVMGKLENYFFKE